MFILHYVFKNKSLTGSVSDVTDDEDGFSGGWKTKSGLSAFHNKTETCVHLAARRTCGAGLQGVTRPIRGVQACFAVVSMKVG